MRPVPKTIIWIAGILGVVLLLAFTAAFFIDEPLRRRMEADMNRSLKGHQVQLPRLDFNPIGFSVTLKNLTLIQDAHPDPPIGRIERLKASVHWFALLRGKLVADFELERPDFHINLIQLRREAAEKVPLEERGWQEAAYAIYPLKVNLLTIHDGKITYIDKDPRKPLVLSKIFLEASNIRNVYSPDRVYPSPFRFTAQIFEKGKAEIEGRANFLADPHPGLEAELNLQEIDLAYFRPILAGHHLAVTGGWFAAQGRMEYAPQIKTAHLKSARIDRVKIDLVHAAQTAQVEKAKAEKAKQAAKSAADHPGLLLRMDDFRLTGEVGFQNKAKDPSYRLFLQQANLHVTNLSNQFREGIAEARLTGHFMGSGQTEVLARFRPEKKGPDFDLHVRVVGTQVPAMNDLLSAHGNFDVSEGQFSLFMEMHVKNQRVEGYVKPFFENMNVYDPRQDQEKPLFRKLYEGVVDRIAELLKNEASEQVATKADISGQIENPEANTLQIIGNLIQNAFVQIILPGFESEVPPRKRTK